MEYQNRRCILSHTADSASTYNIVTSLPTNSTMIMTVGRDVYESVDLYRSLLCGSAMLAVSLGARQGQGIGIKRGGSGPAPSFILDRESKIQEH